MDIAAWLRELGLDRYKMVFEENAIDSEILPDLTEADLEKLGVPLGHRKKLLKAIAALAERSADQPIAGPTVAAAAEAERRQLTVMFCDLVGSTALSARLDPEDMGEVVRSYQSRCAEVITRWEGHIAKYMGDGVLAYFGYPRAHEDDGERAVRAGLDIAEAVRWLVASDGTSLAVRIGIATGLVMVGELIGENESQERTVVGDTPNLAARLQGLAEADSVVIASGTRRLLGGLFELVDLGDHRLKGFPEPMRAWRVIGQSLVEGRFEALRGERLTPLVGRQQELGLLVDRWRLAKSAEGQVVLLSGEPGIGKSRITEALQQHVAGEPHTRLSCYCSPHYTNSALHPVIEQLERAAALRANDDGDTKLDKLETLLEEAMLRVTEVAPLLAALCSIPTKDRYPPLNLTPRTQKTRTLEALIERVEGLAARQPLLIVFEDAHWIDPTSAELLALLIDRLQDLPVLLLITFRPDFHPPWSGHAHVTSLTLNRLGRDQGGAMALGVAGKSVPDEMLRQILMKADGVPLFIEELTKTVLELGLLTDVGDHFELTGPLPSLAIPTTLQDSLMARLDRLAPVKQIAQIGAAIGREFTHELLAAVSPLSEARLGEALDQLIASELIFREGSPPRTTYVFKHALVQETAYESLLRRRRQQLHAQIGTVLEENHPEMIESSPELLAHHFEQGHSFEKALGYWLNAADRADKLSAPWESVAHYWQALNLMERLPPTPEGRGRHVKTVVSLTHVRESAFWRNDDEKEQALRHIDNALEHSAECRDLVALAQLEAFKGEHWNDEKLLDSAMAHAEASTNEAVQAHVALQISGYLGLRGRFEDSFVHVNRAIELCGIRGAEVEQGIAMVTEGRCHCARAGRLEDSLHYAIQGRKIAEMTQNARLKSWMAMEAEPYLYKGLWARAVQVVEEELHVAWEIGNWLVVLFASAWATIAYTKLGRLGEAERLIDKALMDAAPRVGVDHPKVYTQIALSQLRLACGDTEEAVLAGRRALDLAERNGFKLEQGAAHRVLGQIYETKGDGDEAEAEFRQSLDTLGGIQSRPELAQSMLAYGRFKLRNDEKEGRRLLSDALAQFEEMDAIGWIEETRAALGRQRT